MQIKIENVVQNLELRTKQKRVSFDIKNNMFLSKIVYEKFYKTKVFCYKDFSVFVCIVLKHNSKFLRFVRYNIKNKQASVVFDVGFCDFVHFLRINENVFLLLETNKNITTMHLHNLENEKENFKIVLGEVKKIGILKKQKIIVHNIRNNKQVLRVFKLNGEVEKILFFKNFSNDYISFKVEKQKIFVFDKNKKILNFFGIKDFCN